jgi:hypothetical protein
MAQYEGELAWPERFDRAFDIATEYEVGSIAYPGQYQQSPVPSKGGIIKREYWMDYLPTREGKFPDMEIEKVRASGKKYNAKVLVDWYVKLARVAEGYGKDDDRSDFVEVRAELSRLNPEQLLVLKQLALIAAGGATSGASAGGAAAGVRRTVQGKARGSRARTDP